MNILIDIGHPGHVHLFKNLYKLLCNGGYNVYVTVKDIPVVITLLKAYNIPFINIGKKGDSLIDKIWSQFLFNFKTWRIVKNKKIDIGIGTSITLAQVSRFTKMKSILLDDDDDEVQPLFVKYAHPYCDYLVSPDVLTGTRKRKDTVYYPGIHELNYLHPTVFTPDRRVLKELKIKPGEKYFLLRFNAFKAHHDTNVEGLNLKQKLELIELLKKYGEVYITTEKEPESELKPYIINISPEKIHSVLYFSSLFISDSQTMASEAAVLGVPSVRCNTLAKKISYLKEEEEKYGLTFGYLPEEFDKLKEKIISLLIKPDLKNKFNTKREELLSNKINPTNFYSWLIENERKIKSTNFNTNFFNQFRA